MEGKPAPFSQICQGFSQSLIGRDTASNHKVLRIAELSAGQLHRSSTAVDDDIGHSRFEAGAEVANVRFVQRHEL